MTKITFENKTNIKTQALIFSDQTLVNVSLIAPGETCILAEVSGLYDIFLKNGATGWEIARKLGSKAKTLILTKQTQGWFIITERM